MTNKPICRNFG